MNLIFGMKVIYLMRLDSLVKIVVERCTRNTTKVPTVWNINYQIIKNNNTTTQKKASGWFSPMLFLHLLGVNWKDKICWKTNVSRRFLKIYE